MLISSHMIAAGAVGQWLENPILAFLVGIVVHFVLDAIPHYDTTDDGKWTKSQIAFVIGDFVIGVLIIFLYLKPPLEFTNPFWWGALGGIIIDIFDVSPFWKDKFRQSKFGQGVHWFHEYVHKVKAEPFLGIVSQVLIIIIGILIYRTKVLIY